MTDYIVRHGETTASRDGLFAGPGFVTELTDKGVMQAAEAGRAATNKGIERICSSTSPRALETARIIADVLGYASDIVPEPRIAEYDMGILSGTPFRGVMPHIIFGAEGSEDPDEFRLRVVNGVLEQHDPEVDTLFVAHNGVMQVLQTIYEGLYADNFRDLPKFAHAEAIPIDVPILRLFVL